jgi:hypothetical protein
MQARFWEMDRARALALAFLKGVDAVEPHAPGILPIGIEIGQRRHVAPGIPFLAGSGTGMTANANVEVDHEPEFFVAGQLAWE